MVYLRSFTLADADAEEDYILSFPPKLEMRCYSQTNVHPFKLFPQRSLEKLEFEPITIFCGSNGSGKSTLLNIISEKLGLHTASPASTTPHMEDYLRLCSFELGVSDSKIPSDSKKITSDDVFDFLLDVRSYNECVDRRRSDLFDEYRNRHDNPIVPFKSLDDYDEFKKNIEAKRKSKSVYVSKRLPPELDGKSNGESAYLYFCQKIGENALYLLDEPENSLSAEMQLKLMQFIEDSARFYSCQFIISTHSPFLLSLKGARIYDLDSSPVRTKKWTELDSVRIYYDFFKKHTKEFEV